MDKTRILIIEDDPDIQELLRFSLAAEGYQVSQALSAEAGLSLLAAPPLPSLLILDIMLPGMSGLDALRRIKASPAWAKLPVIMASARGEDPDVVLGLELGADDYVVKPYSPRVLVARIRRLLREPAATAGSLPDKGEAKPAAGKGHALEVLEAGPFQLVPARHEARSEGRSLELSATEFSLLELFVRNPGIVFTRSRLISAVRGADHAITDRAVDVQILGLRKKLEEAGAWIETVRGVGYRLRDQHEA